MALTVRGDELVEFLLSSVDAEASNAASNELLDEIFAGYPVENLRPLLASTNTHAVRCGVWLLSELGARAAPLLSEVVNLLDSPIRFVRFFAVDVVLATAANDHGRTIARAVQLIYHSDEVVRWKATQLIARATITQLGAAVPYLTSERLQAWVQRLVDSRIDSNVIRDQLGDASLAIRLLAVAAAIRIVDSDKTSLELASLSSDDEISSLAREQLDLLAIRRGSHGSGDVTSELRLSESFGAEDADTGS